MIRRSSEKFTEYAVGFEYIDMGSANWKDQIGKERKYNRNFENVGIDVIHWEVICLKKDDGISLRVLCSNYPRALQGLRIAIDNGPGMLDYNGNLKREFYIWENEFTEDSVVIRMREDDGSVGFYNTFYEPKHDNPALPCGYRGLTDYSGMLIEKIEDNRFLYLCHGLERTTDFDCLVFELEIVH